MKRIIFVITLLAFISVTWCADLWLEDYATALELAKSKGLPILINFTGSDWCVWCHRLRDEVFVHEEFLKFATSNFILFEADYPKDSNQAISLKEQNSSLLKKFDIKGFPTILIIDSEQNVIGETGYKAGGVKSYIAHLSEFLKK